MHSKLYKQIYNFECFLNHLMPILYLISKTSKYLGKKENNEFTKNQIEYVAAA